MSDLISRQAAIDAIEKYDFSFPEYMERFVTELRDAMKEDLKDDIANLPTAQPEPKWIPVSERLPVLRGTYKITDDVLITNGYEIDMGYLVERTGKIFWHYYGSDYEFGIKDEDNDAIAWMPLPEPYKAERTEE